MAEQFVICNKTDLDSVANAIRTKTGTSGALNFPQDFVSGVESAGGGGASVETVTGTVSGDTWIRYQMLYEDGSGVINSIALSGLFSNSIVVRKNSMLVLFTESVSNAGVGLDASLMESSISGVEVVYSDSNQVGSVNNISLLICKITDNFVLEWVVGDEPV